MKVIAKDLINLRDRNRQSILQLWCESQQEDVQTLIDLMEEVASTAMNASSPQGYEQLENAKTNFVETLLTMSERYRVVYTAPEDKKRRHTDTHV